MNTSTTTSPSVVIQTFTRTDRPKKTDRPAPKPAQIEPVISPPAVNNPATDRSKIIIARVNVGWGNTVYLRGEGGRLNWDIGVPMICTGDDRWVWSCRHEDAPCQFKFLRNDNVWELGDNQAMSGADITVCGPKFPD